MSDNEDYPSYSDTMMDIFDITVRDYRAKWPEQRLGQASFNMVRTERKEWADEIHGSPCDPFSVDENLPAFRAWLKGKFDVEWNQSDDNR